MCPVNGAAGGGRDRPGAEHPPAGSGTGQVPPSEPIPDAQDEQRVPLIQRWFERGLAWSRLLALIPVIFLLLDAAGSFIYGTDILVRAATHVVGEPAHIGGRLGLFLIVMDTYLVGATLMVAAFGFYELFIITGERHGQKHWLPSWLQMTDLDDLKVRVVSMLILVVAITFVDRTVVAGNEEQILFLGLGISVIILALTAFGWFSRRGLAGARKAQEGTPESVQPDGGDARIPRSADAAPRAGPPRAASVTAIFGSTKREGAWITAADTTVIAVAGLARIDLREAVLAGEHVKLRVLAALGAVRVIIPPDMGLTESGTTLLGVRSVRGRGAGPLGSGLPVLVLSDRSVLGIIRVIRRNRP